MLEMRNKSKFEVIVTPNIYSKTYGSKGGIETIIPIETYEEAIIEIGKDIEEFKDNPIAERYHYDIVEYDNETRKDVISVWSFDWKGNAIENFGEWVDSLSESELKFY